MTFRIISSVPAVLVPSDIEDPQVCIDDAFSVCGTRAVDALSTSISHAASCALAAAHLRSAVVINQPRPALCCTSVS